MTLFKISNVQMLIINVFVKQKFIKSGDSWKKIN